MHTPSFFTKSAGGLAAAVKMVCRSRQQGRRALAEDSHRRACSGSALCCTTPQCARGVGRIHGCHLCRKPPASTRQAERILRCQPSVCTVKSQLCHAQDYRSLQSSAPKPPDSQPHADQAPDCGVHASTKSHSKRRAIYLA